MYESRYAPIVIFAYKRIDHLKRAVESLLANAEAPESEVYFFSDGAKKVDDQEQIDAVRLYIESVEGFKCKHCIFRDKNYGLAANIIEGVTDIINKHGEVIVVEDDLILGRHFLEYMNSALHYYRDITRVMAISAYPNDIDRNGLEEYFFVPWFMCWGWATWKDRWELYDKDPKSIIENTSREEIKKININGSHPVFWQQVVNNYSGKLNTWAIFFYVAICKNEGLVLYPKVNHAVNAGMDGTGENCGNYCKDSALMKLYNEESEISKAFSNDVSISDKAVVAFEKYYKRMRPGLFYSTIRGLHYLKENGLQKTINRFYILKLKGIFQHAKS